MKWAEETMMEINRLTPDIKFKAFDPDWFLLRQRLEQFEDKLERLRSENQALRQAAVICPKCGNYYGEHATGGYDVCDCHNRTLEDEQLDRIHAKADQKRDFDK